MHLRTASLLVLALIAFRVFAAPTDDADRAVLLKGASIISTGGVPGGVSAFGPAAFALVAGRDGKKALLPVVAAARWDKGRVVAFGHDGFLAAVDESDTGALLANAARWVCGDAPKPKVGVVNNAALFGHLKMNGFEPVALQGKDWTAKLAGLNAVCVNAHRLTADEVAPLEKFVRAGGGLVTAATGWGWLYGGKEKTLLATEFPGNLLLKRAGLVFTAGTPEKTAGKGFAPGGDLALLNAGTALQALADHTAGKTKLAPDQLTQCGATLADALRALPPDDATLLPKINALAALPGAADFPTPAQPLAADNALARLLVTRSLELFRTTKPGQIRAHPAAEFFPGAVPKSAPRIGSRVAIIDTAVPQWHSTGLYAAPGELIRVSVPPEAVDKGWGVRIGCHTDALWQLEKWQRAPEISRREPLKFAQTSAANPFGGLIYIDVPADAKLGTIQVTVAGAVEAPHFILGKTGALEWKNRVRNLPAPWAELETKRVILSVPSEKIRTLEDPDALMTFWDQVLDAEADLSTIPHERKRPERIVPDTQISAGYMHSGYPIMTFLDKSVEHSLSTAEMKAGSWGHFHELGHNHQQGDWTFEGTTEVTCNLYSLYVMETLCGKPPGQGHDAMKPEAVEKRLRGYLAMTDKFTRWKSDPFLALTMYHQLRTAFGWETYKKVFAQYRELPKSERPHNDDEKRDQWMVRYSRACGKNLGPFFEAWGVPTSEAARGAIQDLPPWMPPDWPK